MELVNMPIDFDNISEQEIESIKKWRDQGLLDK